MAVLQGYQIMKFWPKQFPWDHPGCAFFIVTPIGTYIVLWMFGVSP